MEQNKLSFVGDLDPKKDLWNMKARIVRKWYQKWTIDLILADEKGDQIQGTVGTKLWDVFDPQLKEDDVVVLTKFGVGAAKEDNYPVVKHDYKVNFYRCTTVKPEVDSQGFAYGLYLPRPVFSHGQLYVAVSRVKSKKGLKILICDKDKNVSTTTTNVVYKEVLQSL